ncbi:MAG TPA: acetate--CoA ligase family protein, partial [Anaeromyxobacteraceae bacterium]|nr:acetate--CoA ligase family protein [Anaeromyxobacteraceae bacterium]
MSLERLSAEEIRAVEAILAAAAGEGRGFLHEHEVYAVLQVLGLETPTCHFAARPEELSAGVLAEFGSEQLVLKIVSGDIPHKTGVGGVRKVPRDRERVRAAMRRMREEVLAHPRFAGRPPRIDGFLVTSFVEYSKDLGREALIGFKENLAFGPVVSFSKGGTDAEHFARHFSSPNVRLLPLTLAECRALIESTSIYRKYVAEGTLGYAEKLTHAVHRLALLCAHFSSLNPDPPAHIFAELEVNPFVLDDRGELLAIDGLARILPRSQALALSTPPNARGLDAIFWPSGVAVLGVSASDPGKTGNHVATLLHEMGRKDLHLVNPRGGTVEI